MSLTRQFFREMRPLFRMLEEPFARPSTFHPGFRQLNRLDSTFEDFAARPAIDISEQGDKYILDAELPGLTKDNLEIRVGDNGRSVTIEGKIVESSGITPTDQSRPSEIAESSSDNSTKAVTQTSDPTTQISNERRFTRNMSFTRTVYLPRPVDTSNISAKLENGVLTISATKAEDKASTSITIQ